MSEQPTRAIYVSLPEAAKSLSVSVKTVRRLIADGVIAGLGSQGYLAALDTVIRAAERT